MASSNRQPISTVQTFESCFVAEYPLRMGVPESTLPAPRTEDAALWAFVAELPKQQRAAVALHFLEERSIDEIADILEISASTARVHLHRARTTLRTRLDEEGLR